MLPCWQADGSFTQDCQAREGTVGRHLLKHMIAIVDEGETSSGLYKYVATDSKPGLCNFHIFNFKDECNTRRSKIQRWSKDAVPRESR